MTRVQTTLVVALVGLSWAAALAFAGWEIDRSFFAPFSVVVTVLCGVFLAFNYLLWRLPPFTTLMPKPDLRGTWKGTLRSNWVDPNTGTNVPEREAYLVVYQTYQVLHVRLVTTESESVTLAAVLAPEPDERNQLLTVYRNEPNHTVRDRSAVHFGGTALRIVGDPPKQLAGHYWTDRNTAGVLEFSFMSRSRAASCAEAQALAASAPISVQPAP